MENGILIIGLGNPGPKYEKTRHNIGFAVVDRLFLRAGGTSWGEKFSGLAAQVRLAATPVVLLKPMTFMNLSGRSLVRAAGFFQIPSSRIIVIHDEMDIEFGAVRIKVGGGNGGHNGVASCAQESGDPGFIRVRVGIGRPVHGNATAWVLEKFLSDEQPLLEPMIARAADAVEAIVASGPSAAMNQINRKKTGASE